MIHAYLIQAHAEPEQLAALVDRLVPRGGGDRAVVHLDAKSPLWRKRDHIWLEREDVEVIAKPVAVHWGHASQVLATRRLLAAALARPFDMAHLISGADWPVADARTIAADLARDPARDCFIEARPGEQAERMQRIRLDSRCLRPDPARPARWYGARLLRALSTLVPSRPTAPWGAWHKGSSWWSLPRDVCEVVLAELDRAATRGLLAGTCCADEHLIQTIVAARFPGRIAPDNRRFIRWDGGASPRMLTRADWPGAEASGAWFARKLSREVDAFFLHPPANRE